MEIERGERHFCDLTVRVTGSGAKGGYGRAVRPECGGGAALQIGQHVGVDFERLLEHWHAVLHQSPIPSLASGHSGVDAEPPRCWRDVDPLSFPRIKRRRDLLPDYDDGVKVIRPRFGDELAKQPGRDAADGSQLLGVQQHPG